jgi:hypothetical protein
MSAVHDRLTRHYTAGLDRPAPELFGDHRLEGVTEFHPAAVLIALTERPEPGILLLHRPSNMRAHPGQIAFPRRQDRPRRKPGASRAARGLGRAWHPFAGGARDRPGRPVQDRLGL